MKRLAILALVLFVATWAQAIDEKAMLGQWVPERGANSRLEGLELQKGGKFALIVCISDTDVKQTGKWFIKGNSFTLSFTKGPTWKGVVSQDGKTISMPNPQTSKPQPIFRKKGK